MTRSKAIAHRLREILLDGRWIANTNYKEQLTALSHTEAIHQTGELNSIAALTFHINYYTAGILEVLRGGELTISDKYSFDVPSLPTEADWQQLVDSFFTNATAFISEVEQLPDETLDKVFVKEAYGTYLRNLEGVVEHCYYHLGQIVLLGKLQNTQS